MVATFVNVKQNLYVLLPMDVLHRKTVESIVGQLLEREEIALLVMIAIFVYAKNTSVKIALYIIATT